MTLDRDISTADALAHLYRRETDPHALDRRRFLQLVGMGAGGGLLGGASGSLLDWFVPGHDPSAWAAGAVGPNDGILVIVGMYGGNDGLNTVVPITDPNYYDQRRNGDVDLSIAPENTLALDSATGLNPHLTEFKRLWDAGQLAIVEGVGYGFQDLSHFNSMAYWMAGRPHGPAGTGWIGRWLDGYLAGRPDLYAAAEIGNSVPLHLLGTQSRGTGVPAEPPGWGSATDTRSERGYQAVRAMRTGVHGPWFDAVAKAFGDSFDVAATVAPYYPPSAQLPGEPIVAKLEVAARLINANLGLRVLTAGWDDFDSHAGQPVMHTARMHELDAAVRRFYEVLHPGWASRVTVMTFSEFGRTSHANHGHGTDHGSAAPQFVFGANVAGGFYGERPSLAGLTQWDRMPHTVEMTSYYASIIDGWLGGGAGDVLTGDLENLHLFARPPGVLADGTTAPLPTVIGGRSMLVPVAPARVADTRSGLGVAAGPLGPGATLKVRIAGAGPVPADGVTAVVANVTTVAATEPHYFTVYPGGTARPATSNINSGPGRPVPNLVMIGVGLDGAIEVYNSHGSAHCLVDVFGYFTPGAGDRFTPLPPARLFDTRIGHGVRPGPLGESERVEIAVAGNAGVPPGATAVALNLTATDTEAPGFLRLTPTGREPAETSNVNFFAGDVVPNLAICRLGPDGKVILDGAGPAKHAVGDVFGYFGAAGERLQCGTPRRLLDTREGLGAAKLPIGVDRAITVTVAGRAGVPADATAVVLNVAATSVSAPSFVTVWPAGQAMPGTSNLNLMPGQTIANLVICRLGAGGALTFANPLAACDVIADVFGYFVP
jgi:uncharacterized protein (DUF1501 family)